MAESVIIQQNSNFDTQFFALNPNEPDSETYHPVLGVHELTPYGMMLAGLGACTALVVHTYAHHHDLSVEEVEIRLLYKRNFQDDCRDCEDIEKYKEYIVEEITFRGDLSEEEQEKLFDVSHQCPIHKMYEDGIEIHSKHKDEMSNRYLVRQ